MDPIPREPHSEPLPMPFRSVKGAIGGLAEEIEWARWTSGETGEVGVQPAKRPPWVG